MKSALSILATFVGLSLFPSQLEAQSFWASRNLTDNSSNSNFVNGNYRNCGGLLFFAGGSSTYTYNNEAWVSNGTFAGTFPLASRNIGSPIAYSPAEFTKVGNFVFFAATDAVHGRELWKCDLTTLATSLVKDIRATSASSSPHSLAECNGKLLFICDADNSTVYGDELWVSDGTDAGTVLLKDIVPGKYDSGVTGAITTVAGIAYFDANAFSGSGSVPWRSDGTADGTYQLVNPGTSSSYPGAFTRYNGATYFFMRTANSGGDYSLWRSTETSAEVVKEKVADRLPDVVVIANNLMFFRGYDSANGEEVWKSDGTTDGTVRVTDVGPGTAYGLDGYYGKPSEIVAMGNYVYFVGNDGATGKQLYRTNGTTTNRVALISNVTTSSKPDPTGLIVFNNTLFFRMVRDGYGLEWFTSDGTSVSAAPAIDLWPGTSSGIDTYLYVYSGEQIVIGNSLFFVGRDPSVRQELWRIGPPLTITTQPQSRILGTGSNVTFSVAATSGTALSYLWKKNGVPMSSATAASFSINNLTLAHVGNYEAQLESEDGTAGSAVARLAVVDRTVVPASVAAGGTITLKVTAAAPSGATLSYQWKRGTTDLANGPTPSTGLVSGAQGPILTITKASANEVGTYVCTVSIGIGLSLETLPAAVSVVSPPTVATQPLSRLAAEGTPVTFTTAATNASGVTYKWFFNNIAIAGATSASYSIASPLITNGGSYRCELRNAAGFVYTQYAYLSVVRFTTATLTVADASTLKMSVTVGASPAAGVSYLWRLGGVAVSNGVQPSGASISGATTNAITIANIMSAQAGAWTCQITASALTLTPTVGNIMVKYRPVVVKAAAPAALVSGPFTWQLTASNSPTLFTVSGLPSGLKYTPATGLISGTPLVAGAFTIRAAAANDAGTGPMENLSLPIATLDNSRTGTWTVSIPRHRALNGYLGGLATFVVSNAGTYTGSVANGVAPVAVSGRVTAPVGGNPTILQRIVRPGLLDLWLNITLNPTDRSLLGTLSDGTDTVNVSGGKLAFGASNLASSYSGLYNTTADIRSVYSADSFPQGRGYVQLNVSVLGAVTGVGRAGDGTAYSVSSALWVDARFPLYVQMYGGRGSMSGIAQVSLGATAATTDDRISSTFSWYKMQSLLPTERNYAAGFDIPDAAWEGSRWTATTRGQLPAGWTIKANNGKITVARGSTETAAQSASLVQNFTLATTGAGTFDKLLNLGSITCSANLTTGLCTGSFRLTDPATPPYIRTATYYALMIPHLGNKAYGWFALPKLPQSGETLATSPILAGRVDMVAQ